MPADHDAPWAGVSYLHILKDQKQICLVMEGKAGGSVLIKGLQAPLSYAFKL
jgi:hypothetical protein